jgi:hypothetical protein
VRTQTPRRRVAKALYWASGKLSKIKTPTTTYRLVSVDPFVTEPAGRSWMPCKLSMRVLKWSMHLDWHHWDHWACLHEKCDPVPCAVCGGGVCGIDLDDE